MYLVCSQCRILLEFPVWPTYELLQVFHFSFYMRLEFILFCGTLFHSWLYMVLVARKAKFKLVCLNKLVTWCVSGL
jgi:hypothetical protein